MRPWPQTVSHVFCRGRIHATLAANRIACLNHGVITYRTRFKPGRHEWRPCKIVSHVFCRGRIYATLAANRIACLNHGVIMYRTRFKPGRHEWRHYVPHPF